MPLSSIDALSYLVSPQLANLEHFSTDWQALYKIAKRHSLTPLLHARLEPILERLPATTRDALREDHTQSAAHALFLEFELTPNRREISYPRHPADCL